MGTWSTALPLLPLADVRVSPASMSRRHGRPRRPTAAAFLACCRPRSDRATGSSTPPAGSSSRPEACDVGLDRPGAAVCRRWARPEQPRFCAWLCSAGRWAPRRLIGSAGPLGPWPHVSGLWLASVEYKRTSSLFVFQEDEEKVKHIFWTHVNCCNIQKLIEKQTLIRKI
uniref:Uncharacterized protein n=1 Tax=Arundo donax TaxID=35708 RepID=A0A0A9GRX6_ARUDO